MKLGAVFPQTEIGNDPLAIRDYLQAAEGLGYDHILVFDHVLGIDPDQASARQVSPPLVTGERPESGWPKRDWGNAYTNAHSFHEPFALFAFAAGVTKSIGLASGVLVLPQRQTALVAKQAATVQVLSGGRLRLGVGVGWNPVEFEALGLPFESRGRRVDEQIELLRQLWTEPVVHFPGRWDRVVGAGINPRPAQAVPIWIGGNSDAAMRRAVRLGDGWLPSVRPEEYGVLGPRLVRELEMQGRDAASFGVQSFVAYMPGEEGRWERHLRSWAALDLSHLCVDTMRKGLGGPADHIRALGEYIEVARQTVELLPAAPQAAATPKEQ